MKYWSNSGSADAEIGNVNLKISGAMTVFGARSDAGAGETPSLNRRKMRNLIPISHPTLLRVGCFPITARHEQESPQTCELNLKHQFALVMRNLLRKTTSPT